MINNLRLKAYFNILKNNLFNVFRIRTYPRFAHFFITWRCNLRCKGCSSGDKDITSELDTDSLIKVIRKLPFLDIVKITGGEPFMKEGLPVIVKEIDKWINPYIIQITTNGTYTDRIVGLLKQVPSSNIHMRISLDGIGAVHDRIRGVEGCYEKVRETITALIDVRKKYPFCLGINYSLRDETVPFISRMFEFCRKNNINLMMGYPVKPFLENVDFNNIKCSINTSTDVLEIYRKHINFQNPGTNFIESGFTNFLIRKFFKGKFSNSLKFDCGELRDLIYILPEGNLVTCGLRQQKIFNILHDDFNKNWFSGRIERYRKDAANCPGCMQASIRLLSKIYKMF